MGFIWVVLALIAILAILGWIASSAATANQAQAAIEAARAAQIAAAGQTTQSVLNTVLVVFLVVVIVLAVAMVAFLFWRLNRAETALRQIAAGQQPQPGRWKNQRFSYWGREGDDQPALPAGRTDPIDQLIKLEMVKMLRERPSRDDDSNKPAVIDHQQPWGVVMKQFLVFILIVGALIGAGVLSAGPAITPQSPQDTPIPGGPNLFNLLVADENLRTAEANANSIRVAVTATAAVEQTRAAEIINQQTAVALNMTQQAQATVDAKATADQWTITGWTATADSAEATATMRAQVEATADYRTSIAKTEAVENQNATATARIQETQDAYLAGSLRRAEQREQMVNNLVALTPYAVGGLVLAIVVWIMIQVVPTVTSRMRDRAPDLSGRYPLIVSEKGDIYDVDRNPYPIAQLGEKVGVLADTPRDLQEAVTLRDLLVELITRGAGQQARSNAMPKQMSSTFEPLPAGINGRMFGPTETPPEFARNPETLEILEAQWREAQE